MAQNLDEYREELLSLLIRACGRIEGYGVQLLDSMATGDYADPIRLLEEAGWVAVVAGTGRNVVARVLDHDERPPPAAAGSGEGREEIVEAAVRHALDYARPAQTVVNPDDWTIGHIKAVGYAAARHALRLRAERDKRCNLQGCICPKPTAKKEDGSYDWKIDPACLYHRAAAERPQDHSIPWNCPTYYDGCNCKDSIERFMAGETALRAEAERLRGLLREIEYEGKREARWSVIADIIDRAALAGPAGGETSKPRDQFRRGDRVRAVKRDGRCPVRPGGTAGTVSIPASELAEALGSYAAWVEWDDGSDSCPVEHGEIERIEDEPAGKEE